tara:strand:+ start:6425 stop:6772 length:348 start_codon:yes stop_codon:yes gene_type:complete
MKDQISHEEAHEEWSVKQLSLFRQMGAQERLNTVKSGALEHWADAARATALDLLGDNGTKATSSPTPQPTRFEPANYPLPPQAMCAKRMDLFMIATGGGWAAIMIATAAQAYGLY